MHHPRGSQAGANLAYGFKKCSLISGVGMQMTRVAQFCVETGFPHYHDPAAKIYRFGDTVGNQQQGDPVDAHVAQ